MTLPSPERERWQPLRCGLVNLYRFDAEEFHFHKGRLLLRGNNGTGKSRVLALQLPFLLDGEVASHRLEPDGDSAKRIEWNLLMNRHTDRLGYTWLELGRLTPEGPRYVTLGCGLSATEGKGINKPWLFLTHQRIGESLFLLTPSRTALTRDRLIELIGSHGRVFPSAREYRRALDVELFGLGEDRYEALVDLLIALRQPQLSRKLDEKRLTSTLTQALPRLPDTLLAEVAEAFRSLDADRGALLELESTQKVVDRFVTDYRAYLQSGLRRRAAAVREPHYRYETSLRSLNEAEGTQRALQGQEAALRARLEEVREEMGAAAQRIETLRQSPEMKSAGEIEQAEREVQDKGRQTNRLRQDSQGAVNARDKAQEGLVRANEYAGEQESRARSTRADLDTEWQAAGLPTLPELDGSFAHCDGQLSERQQRLRLVEQRNRELRQAEQELATARQAAEDVQRELDAHHEEVQAAQTNLTAAAKALGEEARRWRDGLQELKLAGEVLDELREWAEDREAERADEPLTRTVNESRDLIREELAALRHGLQADRGRLEVERREHACELEELRQGRHQPPAPSPYRSERVDLAGAPLYMLCDFREDVTPAEQAGLEAALEASGLLDAWVTPDGRMLPEGHLDAAFVAGGPTQSPHLGTRLSSPFPVVDSLLAQIGVEEGGPAWVRQDGSWHLGSLQGRWRKAAAEHVGQGARDEKRRRRMIELEKELRIADRRLAELRSKLQEVTERSQVLEREVAARPSLGPVYDARGQLERSQDRVRVARDRKVAADERQAEARRWVTERRDQRDRDARDVGLSDWVDRTDQLTQLVTRAAHLLSELKPRLENLAESLRQVDVAAQTLDEARTRALKATSRVAEGEQAEREAQAHLDVLRESVGAAAEEVVRKLTESRRHLDELKRADLQMQDESAAVARQQGVAESDCRRYQAEADAAVNSRQEAAAQLGSLLQRGVLLLAAPQVEAEGFERSITRAVEVARHIEAALEGVDSTDEGWKRRQNLIHNRLEELKAELISGDFRPQSLLDGEILLVSVPYQGQVLSLGELSQKLADDVTFRHTLLSAREREVIENHLINDISLQLHNLLHQAQDWVDGVNRELQSRPTSSGMKLRFQWEALPDGPAGLDEARRRLLRKGATWTQPEREALGEFLQRQILAARQRTPGGSWHDHLKEGLDYRQWHRISIERWQDGKWTRLTRSTHGTGSGGEKAIALTVPQFAAAAAYYSSAGPHAPRLILLDEAFVGVDAKMRGQCMGMLEAFDLDFAMTSDREWGTYAELTGTAIYQLTAREGVDAVWATRWVWNGKIRSLAPVEMAPLFADAGAGD